MLKLVSFDGEIVSVIDPNELVSVSIEDDVLVVETKDSKVYLCSFMSPIDAEVVEL